MDKQQATRNRRAAQKAEAIEELGLAERHKKESRKYLLRIATK